MHAATIHTSLVLLKMILLFYIEGFFSQIFTAWLNDYNKNHVFATQKMNINTFLVNFCTLTDFEAKVMSQTTP